MYQNQRGYTMKTKIIFSIVLSLYINFCASKSYDNFTLYRAIPTSQSHLDYFQELNQIYDVNFWTEVGLLHHPIDFVISPVDQPSLLRTAEESGISLITLNENIQRAFDMQSVKTYIRRQMDSFDWNNYFRLTDIYRWLKDLSKVYPDEMKLRSIGTTSENRKIMSVQILLKGSQRRSKVIVEGGIHAREWISPAFVTYFIYQILNATNSNNELLKNIALMYEWYFVPVLNPDGYEFTHDRNNGDRLWRKNRNNGRYGVDLNRNFDSAFGTVGVSKNKRSDIHCGPNAFSEKESQAMRGLVQANADKLEYYLAFHSYGQYMIIPYAHSKEHHDNFEEVKGLCDTAAKVIARRYNTKYTSGTAYDTVGYATSGVSGCWVKQTYRVPYVITFELRDAGNEGFALSPDKITPTCKETMDGILTVLNQHPSSFKKLNFKYSKKMAYHKYPDKILVFLNLVWFIIIRSE